MAIVIQSRCIRDGFAHWILSAVAERFTADLPQGNSFACF